MSTKAEMNNPMNPKMLAWLRGWILRQCLRLCVGLLLGGLVVSAHADNGGLVLDLREQGRWWVAPAGQPVQALATAPSGAQSGVGIGQQALPPGQSLWGWVPMDWGGGGTRAHDWFLRIPLVTLDRVTLWTQVSPDAPWLPSRAGDHVPSRDQRFFNTVPTLAPAVEASAVWLIEIEHPTGGLAVPVQLLHLHDLLDGGVRDALAAGALVGLSLTLSLLSVVQGVRTRMLAFGSAALFFVVLAVATLAHTGVGDVLFWGERPPLGHWLRVCLPILLLGAFTWSTLVAVRGFDRTRRVARLLLWWAVLLALLAVSVPELVPANEAIGLLQSLLLITFLLNAVYLGWMFWLGHAVWLPLVSLVLAFSGALVTVLYTRGVLQGPVLWFAFPVGTLLAGVMLHLRIDRLAAEFLAARQRENALVAHDLITGLPNQVAAEYTLGRILRRSRHLRARGAVALLTVANEEALRKQLGSRGAQAALVRLSARLQQAVRGVDLLARLDDGRFLVLLEPAVTEEAARQAALRWLGAALRTDVPAPDMRVAIIDLPRSAAKDLAGLLPVLEHTLRNTSSQRAIAVEWQGGPVTSALPSSAPDRRKTPPKPGAGGV